MRRPPGAAADVASSPGLQTEESICATPKAVAPRAAVAAPPGVNVSIEPTGASMIGSRSVRPSSVAVVSTLETSRNTRGRSAIESSAWRFRRSVVSVSAPPAR